MPISEAGATSSLPSQSRRSVGSSGSVAAKSVARVMTFWLEWQRAAAPGNAVEIAALEADAGSYLGYVRAAGRRRPEAPLPEPIVSIPARYERRPLLRDGKT